MKAEDILQESAEKNMKRWDVNTFRITHSTLYKTIIESINLALTIPIVVSTSNCKHVRGSVIYGDNIWYKECKKCGEWY